MINSSTYSKHYRLSPTKFCHLNACCIWHCIWTGILRYVVLSYLLDWLTILYFDTKLLDKLREERLSSLFWHVMFLLKVEYSFTEFSDMVLKSDQHIGIFWEQSVNESCELEVQWRIVMFGRVWHWKWALGSWKLNFLSHGFIGLTLDLCRLFHWRGCVIVLWL